MQGMTEEEITKKLPLRIEDRSKAILAVYVNNTADTEDWSQTPF